MLVAIEASQKEAKLFHRYEGMTVAGEGQPIFYLVQFATKFKNKVHEDNYDG